MDGEHNHSMGSPMDGTPPQRWQLKPEALGSIPGGATFLSFPLPFQRSTDSNDPDCLSLDNHYWSSDCGPIHQTPHAVITPTIHYD